MELRGFSLNTLRAFEASARHLSFTRAASELCVTQAAVSHQVRALEEALGKKLFRRTTKGPVLTDEGMLLARVVGEALEKISGAIASIAHAEVREVLTIGVVGTFAVGFLFDRLGAFAAEHSSIEVRVLTNNNRVDLWTESLDGAIRFGDGSWHGVNAEPLMPAPFAPLCSAAIAADLRSPADLAGFPLLRSYRQQDWPAWFEAAGQPGIVANGAMFDASYLMAQAAIKGHGVALLPLPMFRCEMAGGSLVQPFATVADVGSYWITRLASKPASSAFETFSRWLLDEARAASS